MSKLNFSIKDGFLEIKREYARKPEIFTVKDYMSLSLAASDNNKKIKTRIVVSDDLKNKILFLHELQSQDFYIPPVNMTLDEIENISDDIQRERLKLAFGYLENEQFREQNESYIQDGRFTVYGKNDSDDTDDNTSDSEKDESVEENDNDNDEDTNEYVAKKWVVAFTKNKRLFVFIGELNRIYNMLVPLHYRVQTLKLNKRRLKVSLIAYLENPYHVDIQNCYISVDDNNRKPIKMTVSNRWISLMKIPFSHCFHSCSFSTKDIVSQESTINSNIDIQAEIDGNLIKYRLGKKNIDTTKKSSRLYYVPVVTTYAGNFALNVRRSFKGNYVLVKREIEDIEKTSWFKFMESPFVSGFMYHFEKFLSKFRRKKINLLYEKNSSKAEEGAFSLFKLIQDNPSNSKSYFIISKDSEDYEKIKDIPNVVPKYSFKYYRLMFSVSNFISTDAPSHLTVLRSNNKYIRRTAVEHPFIFLQHGVTYLKRHGDNSTYVTGKEGEASYVVVGSEKEKEITAQMFKMDESLMLKTGLPVFANCQYKHMNQNSDDYITIMLTWKPYEEHLEHFENSTYFENVMHIYHMLTKYVDPSKIIIVPHPKVFDLLSSTELGNLLWKKPVSEVLSISKLLITDYSSVCYNSFYQGGGVIFFQPDLERYQACVGKLIPYDDEYIGKRVFTWEELDKIFAEGLKSGKINLSYYRTKENEAMYKTINEFSDGKNVERIYKELVRKKII